jgi:hypothetical protein
MIFGRRILAGGGFKVDNVVDSIFISSRSILKHDFKPVLSFSESERDL